MFVRIKSNRLEVRLLDDELALFVLLLFFVGSQLEVKQNLDFCRNGITYIGPADNDGALDTVDVSHDVPPCHHFFLALGAKEDVYPVKAWKVSDTQFC